MSNRSNKRNDDQGDYCHPNQHEGYGVIPLLGFAALPHGTGGVDDVLAGEVIPARDLGLAETEGCEAGALGVQLLARDGMYGEVYAAVADHFFVGGVDDGVHAHFGDVIVDDL